MGDLLDWCESLDKCAACIKSMKRLPKKWLEYVCDIVNLRESANIRNLRLVFDSREKYLKFLMEKHNLCAFTLIYYGSSKNEILKAKSLVAQRHSIARLRNRKYIRGLDVLKYFKPLFGDQFWPSVQLTKKSSGRFVLGQRIRLWPPSWETLWRVDRKCSEKSLALIERTEAQNLKPYLYKLQRGKCKYCKLKFTYVRLCVDHVIPISRGGETSLKNCVLSCKPCNCKKGANSPSEKIRKLSESLCWCKNKAVYRLVLPNGNYDYTCTKHLPKKPFMKSWINKVEKIDDVITLWTVRN